MAGQTEGVNTHKAGTETVAHGALSDPPECWMGNNTLCFEPVGTWNCQTLPIWQSFSVTWWKRPTYLFYCEDKDRICSLLEYVFGWKQKFVKKSISNLWKLNCKNIFRHKHEPWGHHPHPINNHFQPVRARKSLRPRGQNQAVSTVRPVGSQHYPKTRLLRTKSYNPTTSPAWGG